MAPVARRREAGPVRRSAVGHGARWTIVVLATLGAFGLPWITLTLADAGSDATLALASTVSAAVLSAGGWYAARETREQPPEPRSPLLDRLLVIGALPREPLAFQKREQLVEAVEQAMERNSVAVVCALTGGRGVGKTQLAGVYARSRIDAGWRVVVWIVAEGPGQVVAGLDELAEAAGIRGGIQDAQLAATAARQWLEQLPEPALLVLDNVVDPDEVTRWLPRTGQTRTLITSTVRSVTHLGATVDIGVFEPEEAVAFLLEMSRAREVDGSAADAGELAADLGWLPLALAQAAWVIRTQGLTFAEYRERFRRRRVGEVMRRAPGEPYPSGAAEALHLAIGQAEAGESTSTVRRVVEFISLLSPSGVSREDLHAALREPDPAGIDAVVGRLTEGSVVTLSLDGGTVLMHRLVQRIVRDRMLEEGRLGERIDEVAGALRALLYGEDETLNPDAEDRGFSDHILALWAATEPLGDDSRCALLDLCRAGVRLLVAKAELDRACRLGQDVLADHERLVAAEGDETLRALVVLANAYQTADQSDRAVPLHERRVQAYRARLGSDHPKTLSAVNSLGYALETAGRLDEAQTLHIRNLEDSLRVNGPDHQTTVHAQINLASTLRSKGDNEAALALFEKNAADNERAFGADHGSTLNARGELARMYERVGRYEEALALYDRVWSDLPRVYPDDRSLYLWWGRYRALALQSTGRTDEAIDELNRLLEESRGRYGHDHPETISIRIFLARAHTAAGRHGSAIRLFERCLADRGRVIGLDSSGTLNARRNLGLALLAAGKRSRAVTCLDAVLTDYERVLGPHHPFSEGARADLARARAVARARLRRIPAAAT
ncbi:FxSxx-COOH system tetratricopeptide repeat protein [Streptomyces sp. NPDC001815]|uniref:FxSxx-COOH system tetratricopeptide repeat protein n=1 Tax=Streptomyces sp. NPDC001815 TaxID=3154526 RepID=UPI00332C9591